MGDSNKKKSILEKANDLRLRISLNRKTFIIYSILRGFVLLTLIRMIMTRNLSPDLVPLLWIRKDLAGLLL